MGSRRIAVASLLKKIGLAGAGIGVSSWIVNSSIYTVGIGKRAVVVDRDESVGEGVHVLIPWLQRPVIADIRKRRHTLSYYCTAKNIKKLRLTVRLLSRPDISRLPHTFKSLGTLHYDEKFLISSLEIEIQNVVSQFESVDLTLSRQHFTDVLRRRLTKRLAAEDLNIVLDELFVVSVEKM